MHVDPVELAELVIGSPFVAIGGAAAAGAMSARGGANRSAAWFAVFCVLYGLRLLAGSDLVRLLTQWSETFFRYVDAYVTYTILLPATLFVESLLGPGRHGLLRRTWQFVAICAAGAILVDLIARRPHAAISINIPLVVITVAVWFAHIGRAGFLHGLLGPAPRMDAVLG